MTLFNGTCNNCICGDGKPITCNECGGILRGGFCLPCNLKAENSYPDAYSFNDFSYNSNYLPQPQYENYLCNLCGNNSHDGYDCQQQFSFVYEQEPSYNQNYNDNYPYDLPSFPYCDNCEGSQETFQCQPINQNIDFSCSDQIQIPQYPEIHPSSQEKSEEVSQAREDLIKLIQTFLEEFHCIPLEEKPTMLLQAWFNFFAIKHDQPENSNELFQKLLEDLKELTEYKEYLENSSKEIDASNSNEEKEEPPQDYDIHQLIEECSVNKLLSINSQRLDKEEQKVKNVIEQPAERGNQLVPILSENEVTLEDKRECDMLVCEDSSTSDVCDDHSEIFSNSKNDDDILVYDDFEDVEYIEVLVFDPEITSVEEENDVEEEEIENFLNDDSIPIGVDNSEFNMDEDILFLEGLLSEEPCPIPPMIPNQTKSSIEELEHSFSMGYEHFNSTLVTNKVAKSSIKNLVPIPREYEVTSDNEIDDDVTSNDKESIHDIPIEESKVFTNPLFDDDLDGEINVVEELLSDNCIPFTEDESSDSDHQDDPSIPRPPPKPPDAEFNFEPDAGKEIPVVMNDKDEFDDDYFPFMFVIQIFLPYLFCSKMFISFLSAKSEARSLTLVSSLRSSGFLPSVIEVFLCWIFVSVSMIFTSFDWKLVWGNPYPLISIA
uniref:Pre-mRNA splicing Prp18-interacting factor n=1 Tax=Tanacetum cinerariifolium TaxID=118510 RepID=A0A6L2KBY2_TANCI|nr:hypothetical protein [Tanacetum cinerariifolium]